MPNRDKLSEFQVSTDENLLDKIKETLSLGILDLTIK
jgi:hypothetical protein